MAKSHPLDPLTVAEISTATAYAREAMAAKHGVEGTVKFISVMLREPRKEELMSGDAFVWEAHAATKRLADVVCIVGSETYELTVDVTAAAGDGAAVASEERFEHVPGVQPGVAGAEFGLCEKLVREDPRFQELMRKRGHTDPTKWMVEPWSAGYFGDEAERGQRLVRALVWVRIGSPYDNGYAHPVEGLQPVVDLANGKVLEVLEEEGAPDTPLEAHNFSRVFTGEARANRDIVISQPDGVNFSVDGHVVQWHDWRFVVGFNQREGLTLHCIEFAGRPILYRLAMNEMVVPYFSNVRRHAGKNAFDVGEYGLGNLVNSLALGCDCVGDIYYFDVTALDMDGTATVLPRGICLHEEDDGVLWKHTDWRLAAEGSPHAMDTARATKLVVSMFCTVGNYEYGVYYNFMLDGNIEPEIKATGLVNTSVMARGRTRSEFGQTLSLSGLEAQHHQHAFNFRMDFCVDGAANTAYEWNSAPADLESNPFGNAVRVTATKLSTEREAQRDVDAARGRFWTVANERKTNRVNEPVAYAVVPGSTGTCMLQEGSWVRRRAPFMLHHLWVTPFAPGELYAAGRYPNQSSAVSADGLGDASHSDRPIADTDLVVWHTTILHHVVRLEDFPVQPVVRSSFLLRPNGFFDYCPCLRIPARAAASSKLCCAAPRAPDAACPSSSS